MKLNVVINNTRHQNHRTDKVIYNLPNIISKYTCYQGIDSTFENTQLSTVYDGKDVEIEMKQWFRYS